MTVVEEVASRSDDSRPKISTSGEADARTQEVANNWPALR
jgi:hypothetical protein